jgi:hypothetical protein
VARTRKSIQENEKLTDANITRVIGLLNPKEEGVKAITKKEACSILGIAYNTTRLQTILDQFVERIAKEKEKRAAKRGKPASNDEISYTIAEYLTGQPIDSIAKSLYRGTSFVKAILEKYSVPIRQSSHNYFKPELIPDGAVKNRFNIGEIVYSARYDSTAKVVSEQEHPVYGWTYRVWLLSEAWQQFAAQPACELASLEHLKEFGIVLK